MSDTAFASWLLESLTVFVERATVAYECYSMPGGYSNRQRKDAARAFIQGVCDRINRKLAEIIKPTMVKNSSGTTLIVLDKSALIQKSLDDSGQKFGKAKKLFTQINNDEAFYAGWQKGEAATFNRPIDNASEKQYKIK